MVDVALFEEVADVVVGLVPATIGRPRCRARRAGIKVWFGTADPPREHYEAQLVGADMVDGARVVGLEVGFHSEHPQAPANDAVVGRLVGRERQWRRSIGREAVAGEFLGRREWRRISETWPDPDLDDPGLAFEVGARLTDYITALEPLR
ncbi:MAG TPA: hypothetical protein VFC99_13700 [Acidimicrobiia bacterium]|nr:hypothetical protein [Acidimicrobiia bacterium]